MLSFNRDTGDRIGPAPLREASVEISSSSAISNAVEGLKKAQNQIEQSAQNIAEGAVSAEDVVSLSLAATSFKANAAVIRTENDTMQTLLDVTV
jgi:hypothetical protein